jgi:hypothetical protein
MFVSLELFHSEFSKIKKTLLHNCSIIIKSRKLDQAQWLMPVTPATQENWGLRLAQAKS